MAITKPAEMNFSNKKIFIVLSGLPGTWKTTTACSAKNALLVDFDDGLARVKPEHRIDSSICTTYEEFLRDVKEAEGKYETIIIDTCGALIEFMKDWAMRTDPKASKKDGGFSLQGYGVVKTEFLRMTSELRKKFNVIFLFHESMERNGDEGVFYQLVVEGSARTLVWQPADLGGHFFVDHGKHYIGFTPTEQYSAKSAYGISGIIEVPELKDGEPNVFMTKLFDKIRKNLDKEAKELAPKQAEYKEVMEAAKRVCDEIKKPEDVAGSKEALMHLPHVLTSEAEAKNMFNKRLKELNIVFDKSAKAYKYAE